MLKCSRYKLGKVKIYEKNKHTHFEGGQRQRFSTTPTPLNVGPNDTKLHHAKCEVIRLWHSEMEGKSYLCSTNHDESMSSSILEDTHSMRRYLHKVEMNGCLSR